jgi:hypothetical protein
MTTHSDTHCRHRRLNIRLSQQEWNFIQGLAANSTCRSVSEYARKVLAQKPVKVLYRNQSFDEFEEQMTSRFLPLLEQFRECTSRVTAGDPVALTTLQSFATIFKDIRGLLAKLSDQCAQK